MHALPYRPIMTAIAALAILLAAMGMIGCSATTTTATADTSDTGERSLSTSDQAHTKFEKDRAAILAMAGEYDVTFDFKETLALREGYELKEPYLEHASEMVVVVADTGDFISMQHLLVVGDGKDAHVVKHWRQDWMYEGKEGYDFKGKRVWEPMVYDQAERKGAWVQSVYQVDDSPRYWGIGKWTHRDGVSTWSAATNRPLPRREFSKRKDYQVLGAVNTQVVTDAGWMHYQSNHKLDKSNADEPVIALERGVNTYAKTTETDFSAAREYWENTAAYWAEVRSAWADIYGKRQKLTLKSRWKGDKMYSHIFDLAEEYWGKEDVSTAKAKVKEVIGQFMGDDQVAQP